MMKRFRKIYSTEVESRLDSNWNIIVFVMVVGLLLIDLSQYVSLSAQRGGLEMNFWEFAYEYFTFVYRILFVFPILYIIFLNQVIKLDQFRYITMIKMDSRKKNYLNILRYNLILSVVSVMVLLAIVFTSGVVSGLSMKVEVKDYVYGSVIENIGGTNINMASYFFMVLLAFFLYIFLIGIIYSVFYYLTKNSVNSTLLLLVFCYFAYDCGGCRSIFKVLTFRSNINYTSVSLNNIYNSLWVIAYWIANIFIWSIILKVILERVDFVKKVYKEKI